MAPDWNNLQVLHRNTLPARSHFFVYRDKDAALRRDIAAASVQCLSGTWQFHLSPTPFEGPRRFYAPDFDAWAFRHVAVPGMWQLQGYGKGPHYTNIQYPWPVDPPNVPLDANECGRYRTIFTVHPDLLAAGDVQLRLRFEGVDAAFTIWLNGHEVGYSQGARNPSEFDVTALIDTARPNTLAVEVYQRCDGSYLEDQDQWWLSGIFRDVFLHAFPQPQHLIDFHVQTELDAAFEDAVLRVQLHMSGNGPVQLTLQDAQGGVAAEKAQLCTAGEPVTMALPVTRPNLWTAETPYLYDLVLTFGGTHKSYVVHRVGFRHVALGADAIFRVNGRPVKLRGVNRHEHHPDTGRTVPLAFLRHDLLLMKKHGINAVRTSHQINDYRLYELADELGLWIIDEADLECHGFDEIGAARPAAWTSDNPMWEAAYVDRAVQMVQRDRNFACIVIWSLGNESFYGRNHEAMYTAIRAIDGGGRVIHYEGDQQAVTSDVYSRMYPPVETVVQMATQTCVHANKPLLLCEFIHAMGNGPGGIQEYIEAFYAYPLLMGGFLWEWANHGLRAHTSDGDEFMAYGGDFGDFPNDSNFVMDGCTFSNHTPTPALFEYAKAIEPVQSIALTGDTATIVNRYDFLTLDHLVASWQVVSDDGHETEPQDISIPAGIAPHTSSALHIAGVQEAGSSSGESWLRLSFRLREATPWAPQGHQVAFGEFQLTKPTPLATLLSSIPARGPTIQFSATALTVTSASGVNVWTIDRVRGLLSSWQRGSREMLSLPMTVDFGRALTDNDREIHGRQWIERRLNEATHTVRSVEWAAPDADNGVTVTVCGRVAPPVLLWGVDVVWTFRFVSDALHLNVRGRLRGELQPDYFARIGLNLGLLPTSEELQVGWFGRGPGESYRDKKHSQPMGTWTTVAGVSELLVDYEFPQECSNRTDVRSVEFVDSENGGRLLRARFGDLEGASFTALHYTSADLEASKHPYELHKKKRADTIVRLDWAHHGLGSGSCGPATYEVYRLNAGNFGYNILLD